MCCLPCGDGGGDSALSLVGVPVSSSSRGCGYVFWAACCCAARASGCAVVTIAGTTVIVVVVGLQTAAAGYWLVLAEVDVLLGILCSLFLPLLASWDLVLANEAGGFSALSPLPRPCDLDLTFCCGQHVGEDLGIPSLW